MIAYLNPKHGNDATAQMDSRARPWRTAQAAMAALEAARAAWLVEQSATVPAASAETFRLVETHKPLAAA